MKDMLLSPAMLSRIKILNALEELLKTNELDSITVRQICEEAGVGRTTFYAHFKDKYDVVLWYDGMVHMTGVGQIGRTLTWEEGTRKTCEGILAKVDMLNKASRSTDHNAISPYTQRWRIERMEETLAEYKGVKVDNKLHGQVVALAAGQTEIGTRYFFDKNRYPVDEFVDIMVSIVPKELYTLLEEPAGAKAQDEEIKDMELALMIIQQAYV